VGGLTPAASAMKVRIRAESRTPAMPTTRSAGSFETRWASEVIASTGFETISKTTSGLAATRLPMMPETISAFFTSRSSRLMPGLRARPAVTIARSLPAVAS